MDFREHGDGRARKDYLKRTVVPLKRVTGPLGAGLAEAGMQADAAVRGAANVLTFGLADKMEAGADALLQGGPLRSLPQRYAASADRSKARTRYDAEHRRLAQATGQVGGTAAGLALTPTRALGVVKRLPGAASMTVREAASLLGAGGAAGVGMQGAGDLITGKISTPGDFAGAAVGGIAGVLASPLGVGQAAAIDGAVTSVAQDLLNERRVSLEGAGQSAIAGKAAGRLAEEGVLKRIGEMSSNAKGRFGEALGEIRRVADWKPRDPVPKNTHDPLTTGREGAYWKPDGWRGTMRYEDKFGPSATLKTNQKLARAELGDDFYLSHLFPEDAALILSMPVGAAGVQINENLQRGPQRPIIIPSVNRNGRR